MILQSESEEEETGLGVPLTQPPSEDFIPVAIATRPVLATMREEEEEMIVLAEELARYFLSPLLYWSLLLSADLGSSSKL